MAELERWSDRLAEAAADGLPVDWDDEQEQAPNDMERRVVAGLRLVSAVAQAHRTILGNDVSEGRPATETTTPSGERSTARSVHAFQATADVPRVWAHLEVIAPLGRGAYGQVVRARDTKLDRDVALKLVAASGAHSAASAQGVVEEGRLLARVRHPNVVTVYGADVRDGWIGLWMELVDGADLSTWVGQHGPLSAHEAVGVGIDVCRAVAAVHRRGLIHRDIKAANVMRESGGRIVLMDFGIAAVSTSIGRPIGTPLYMAPELLAGGAATQRTDVYSLGVLLFFLLTGTYPFMAMTLEGLREAHARGKPRTLRDERPGLPERLVRAIENALHPDPAQRTESPGRLESALAGALGESEIRDAAKPHRRPVRQGVRALAITALVAAALAISIFGLSRDAWFTRPVAPLDIDIEFRREGLATIETLLPGARLRPGDQLFVELETDRDVYVYIVNRDEAGEEWLLFPAPSLQLVNPLRGGARHRLPGFVDGLTRNWLVTSAGAREQFLVVASEERLQEFEEAIGDLPAPTEGKPVIVTPLPTGALRALRGVGGLTISKDAKTSSSEDIFSIAARLDARQSAVNGPWIRSFAFDNPPEP